MLIEKDKKELILKNINIIKHLASKYYVDDFNISYDALLSNGMSGLLKSVDEYNTKTGIKFSVFAFNNIKHYILNEIKRASSLSREDVLQIQEFSDMCLLNFNNLNKDTNNNSFDCFNNNIFNNISISLKNKCLIVFYSYLDVFLFDDKEVNFSEFFLFLTDNLKHLSYLEQLILDLIYKEDLTYYQIKSILNIHEDLIFNIHLIALSKIRQLIKDSELNKNYF